MTPRIVDSAESIFEYEYLRVFEFEFRKVLWAVWGTYAEPKYTKKIEKYVSLVSSFNQLSGLEKANSDERLQPLWVPAAHIVRNLNKLGTGIIIWLISHFLWKQFKDKNKKCCGQYFASEFIDSGSGSRLFVNPDPDQGFW